MAFTNSLHDRETPAYGCAECSNCINTVDLNDALIFGIIQRIAPQSNEYFYFMLCDKCSQQHFSLVGEAQLADGKKVLENGYSAIELHGLNHGKAITTLTALIANDFDFAKAIEDGVNITPELHKSIHSGSVDPFEIRGFLREAARSEHRSPAQRKRSGDTKSPASRNQYDTE